MQFSVSRYSTRCSELQADHLFSPQLSFLAVKDCKRTCLPKEDEFSDWFTPSQKLEKLLQRHGWEKLAGN
jgi:hypothetical protein